MSEEDTWSYNNLVRAIEQLHRSRELLDFHASDRLESMMEDIESTEKTEIRSSEVIEITSLINSSLESLSGFNENLLKISSIGELQRIAEELPNPNIDEDEISNGIESPPSIQFTAEEIPYYMFVIEQSIRDLSMMLTKETRNSVDDEIYKYVYGPKFQEFRSHIEEELVQTKEQFESEIDQKFGKIDQKISSLEKLEEELEQQSNSFENRLQRTEEYEEKIQSLLEDAEKLREDTSQLVKERVGEALGDVFTQRRKELERSMRVWLVGSILSILLLLFASRQVYLDISSGAQGIIALSKLAILIPISVAVWFTVSNYSRQRKLMQEYEFKSNIALSLRGFREVLRDDVPEGDEEIVAEFMISSLDKVYSDPMQNLSENIEKNSDGTPATPTQHSADLMKILQNLNK